MRSPRGLAKELAHVTEFRSLAPPIGPTGPAPPASSFPNCLYPYRVDGGLIVPRTTELIPFREGIFAFVDGAPCLKCGQTNLFASPHELCTGRRAILFFRRGCPETREHFHVHCYKCRWEGLMAPKE